MPQVVRQFTAPKIYFPSVYYPFLHLEGFHFLHTVDPFVHISRHRDGSISDMITMAKVVAGVRRGYRTNGWILEGGVWTSSRSAGPRKSDLCCQGGGSIDWLIAHLMNYAAVNWISPNGLRSAPCKRPHGTSRDLTPPVRDYHLQDVVTQFIKQTTVTEDNLAGTARVAGSCPS